LAALALAAVVAVVEFALVRPLAEEADEGLRDRLASLAAVVAEGGEDGFRRRAPSWVRPGRSEFAALRDPRGGVLASAGRTSSAGIAAAREGEIRDFADPVAGRLRVLATTVPDPRGRTLVAVAGVSAEETTGRLLLLRTLVLAAAGGGVLLVGAGAWFGAALVLDPLRRMTEGARSMPEASGGRLPVRDPGNEFDDLARLLNELLARSEAALEDERRFAGDAAHELRSPLALLRLRAESALASSDPAEAKAALEGALADADRLHRLIEALLELSRSPAPDPGTTGTADVAATLAPLEEDFRTLAGSRGLAFSLSLPGPGVRVAAPREVVETTVAVLVDNAFRYTPAGGSVAVEAAARPDGLRIRVRDTGPGIPPDEAGRIFDRLFRGRSGKSARGGFGLGLALARRLARSAGGDVRLENPGEAGACFLVLLPASRP
jgi:signal transduction histidine kinase